jgi:hypothetical protein
MAKEPLPVLLVVALAPDRSWALPWVPVNSATEVANAGARFAVVRQKSNLTHSNDSLGLSIRHEYQRPLWADIVCNLAPPPSGWGSRLRNSSRSTEFDLWWGQGILGQGPAAVAIDQRLKSRISNRLRSLKPAKYQPIEFKIFPADMSNDVDR